jgi:hypothetical protein
MRLSPRLRKRHYYKVAIAGAQVGYSRAGSYRAADDGVIPTEWHGRFRLVPRKTWDRIRKRILRGLPPTPQPKPATAAGDNVLT